MAATRASTCFSESASPLSALSALPLTIGILSPGNSYCVNRSRTSISTRSRSSGSSTMSTLLRKTTMEGTPTCRASRMCSRVCGIGPSAAETTRIAPSICAAVADLESARRAVEAGATVVQLRIKGASTAELVAAGPGFAELRATFVVDDDVTAALELGADGVHLGQSDDGVDRALEAGLLVGLSVATRREAAIAEFRGAGYLGAGAIWPTPSMEDATAIGLDTRRVICMS